MLGRLFPTYDFPLCEGRLQQVILRLDNGMKINVVDSDQPHTWAPNIKVSDFRNRLNGPISYLYPTFSKELQEIPAGSSIIVKIPYLIVARTALISEKFGLASLCIENNPESRISYLQSVTGA